MNPNIRAIADKVGVVGALVSTMSCTMCFPAAASLGAALGLGFLSRWEPLFFKLLPIFAATVIVVNGLGWLSHRQWQRSALGMIGPILVLTGRYALTGGTLNHGVSRGVLYAGLAVMTVVAICDMLSPANRRCMPDGGEMPCPTRDAVKK